MGFYGCWTGAQTFWTHLSDMNGYDWRDGEEIDRAANGTYMSDLLGDRSVQIANEAAGTDDPFFMFVSFTNPHTPLEAPQEYIDMYPGVTPPSSFSLLIMAEIQQLLTTTDL